jgi:transposase-like protein
MKKIEKLNSFRQRHLVSETISSREIQEMLLAKSKQAVLALGVELLEQEVEELCGRPFERKRDALYHRGGSEGSSLVYDGAKYPFNRPRVRSNDGEVPLKSLAKLRDQDLMDEDISGRVIRGITTRNYDEVISGYSRKLGVSKSSISRAFVRASKKDLEDINTADLSQHRFIGIMIDGVNFAGRVVIGALGITDELEKIPIGIKEGDTENADVVRDLLAEIMGRNFRLRCPRIFAVIDGSRALKRGLLDIFGDKVIIQRCWLHKLRNLKSYAPDKYHKQIHWRMKKLMNIVDINDAIRELASLTRWLGELSHECESSMEEVGEELLSVHRLGLPKLMKRSLSTTNAMESLIGVVRHKTGRIKNWRHYKTKTNDQITRWAASSIKSHQKRMNRLMGYRDVRHLIAALGGDAAAESGGIQDQGVATAVSL